MNAEWFWFLAIAFGAVAFPVCMRRIINWDRKNLRGLASGLALFPMGFSAAVGCFMAVPFLLWACVGQFIGVPFLFDMIANG